MEIELNWLAVILAALSTMVVGSLWYGPLFGKMWAKLAKVKTDPNFGAAQAVPLYLGAFIGSFVTALVLAIATFIAHQFYGGSFLSAAVATGGVLWLGFTAARVQMHDSFEGRPKALTALTVLHEFVTILVMAVIIGVWPA